MPLMTTRRWMIAVAVVAMGVWTLEVASRAQRHRSRAVAMREREMVARAAVCLSAGAAQGDDCHFTVPDDFDPETAHLSPYSERYRRLLFYYRRMRQKYEMAARRPWLPVEPDPPLPQ
jgi:hypothetical protein